MANHKTIVNIRMNAELKEKVEELLGELGYTLNSIFTLFIKRSLDVGGLPFLVTVDIGDSDYEKDEIGIHASYVTENLTLVNTKDTANVTIRIDKRLKEKGEFLFKELGLNMSNALSILVRKMLRERKLPFKTRPELEVDLGLTESDATIEKIAVQVEMILENKKSKRDNSDERKIKHKPSFEE